MGAFTVAVTITGVESGLSETMEAVVDAGVLHSVIPADALGRLGVLADWPHPSGVWMRDGGFVELPRGSAKVRLHISDIPVDGGELDGDDLCGTVPVLFGPPKSQPVVGRSTLSFLDLAVGAGGDCLVPAEVRIPGEAMMVEWKQFAAQRSARCNMGGFTVAVTITGIESGLSETMAAVVDASVLHSVIPADALGRLGVLAVGRSSVVGLPRGNARARLHISDDDMELGKGDFCATISVLFGPDGGRPVLGRTTLSALVVEVDGDNGRLIPAELRIPADAMMVDVVDASPAGEQPAASREQDGSV